MTKSQEAVPAEGRTALDRSRGSPVSADWGKSLVASDGEWVPRLE